MNRAVIVEDHNFSPALRNKLSQKCFVIITLDRVFLLEIVDEPSVSIDSRYHRLAPIPLGFIGHIDVLVRSTERVLLEGLI